jgi:hypothetical protein
VHDRKPDLDKVFADLVAQLKAVLIAREQERVVEHVNRRVDAVIGGLLKPVGGEMPLSAIMSAAASLTGRGQRKPRSESSKKLQAEKMKAYWAKRKAAEAKGGKAKGGGGKE